MTVLLDDALLKHLEDGDFGLSIAYEGEPFNPPNGEPYLEPAVMPNPQFPVTIAHSEQVTGIFRVFVKYPAGAGAVAAKKKAEEIAEHFRSNTTMSRGSQSLIVQYTQRGRGYVDKDRFIVPVTIAYKAFIQR